MTRTRSYRLHQNQRWLNRARTITRIWAGSDQTLDWADEMARRIRDNRKPCSCCMCAGPRHNPFNKGKGRLTHQELKQIR